MSGFIVSAGEWLWVSLSADPVDADCEVVIGDGSTSSLYSPKGFGKPIDCSRGVEHDFSSIESESHPVKRMVAAVADVDSDPAKVCLEDGVAAVSLHVVS